MSRLAIPLLCAFILVTAALPAKAGELVIDLSKSVVAITTGFEGSDLLLFGAAEGEGDIVVVVSGPQRDETVRRKKRTAGVWVNRDEMVFDQVPGFYAIAGNRPIDEFMSEELRANFQIGLEYLELQPSKGKRQRSEEEIKDFRQALIRNKQRQGLYGDQPGSVIFLGNRLFRSRLSFPVNVNVGTYGVDVYLVRDGKVATIETTLLTVRKFGFEAGVYDFAHRQSMSYGIFAIIIAVMAGWLAGTIFRKA
ncbi:MAG: hypothetical protein A3G18_03010 [Rhodospirillales bacterium RIFCSPLOWO2_12_FULL_58_28]|nr:MAG: hypothetical protein A3H92_13470 [Rhodospirillales bacterium RIFCSPLOWO2_02_FULL_58_16]OHC77167.1 MAG: hypothetical protein A3G18_03010 [Rhodospirillales bacterium RIFCSPLOWO2_12_FULL_58_28]